MNVRATPLRVGAIAAWVSAAGALAAAVAGGVAEPSGVAAALAILAAIIAYGVAPLVIAIALRLAALSSWRGVAAAAFACALWAIIAMLLVAPALVETAPGLAAALIAAAPTASALWIVAASIEVLWAGLERWSLVVFAGFVSVLMIASVFIDLTGFDVMKVAVPLGWTVWMLNLAAALRARMRPTPAPAETPASACGNCGAPRRRDGLAFCADCGLPYGVSRDGESSSVPHVPPRG